jgi:glycerol-1-phosphate dehydrogenase [NAD(P)+]
MEVDESLHYMQLPREVIVGKNVLGRVGEVCTRLGFTGTALVVSGPITYPLAGEPVAKSVTKAGLKVDHVIVKESTQQVTDHITETIKKSRASLVLGVGGGKDIDLAKLSSAKSKVPFMSVPTAASHDGIASPYASIKGGSRPYSVRAQAPVAILIDIGVIADSPYNLLAAGCADIVAKFTAVKDWQLAHKLKNEYYGDYAANLAMMSAKLVTKNAKEILKRNVEGVKTVVEALISCGVAMSIAGSNWEAIRTFLKEIGAPSTAKELNVSSEQLVRALMMAHSLRPERYTILGETGVAEAAAEKVARTTGVIG